MCPGYAAIHSPVKPLLHVLAGQDAALLHPLLAKAKPRKRAASARRHFPQQGFQVAGGMQDARNAQRPHLRVIDDEE